MIHQPQLLAEQEVVPPVLAVMLLMNVYHQTTRTLNRLPRQLRRDVRNRRATIPVSHPHAYRCRSLSINSSLPNLSSSNLNGTRIPTMRRRTILDQARQRVAECR